MATIILFRPVPAFVLLGGGLLGWVAGVLGAGELPELPMAELSESSIRQRWLSKEVLETRIVDGMESPENWEHHGFGRMSFDTDRAWSGERSLLLTSPTKGDKPGGTMGRPFGEAKVIRRIANENWEKSNRLSLRVYPDLPGFRVVSLCLVLHNEGEEKVPGADQRHGRNFVLLRNHEWNHVTWEIAHLGRDRVTGVEMCYRLQGHETGATDTVRFNFDALELERVIPDHFLGWQVASGEVAYSHTGYLLGFSKMALGSDLAAGDFDLVRAGTGEVVLRREVEIVETDLGRFQVLDFSEHDVAGSYRLRVGSVETPAFRIGSDVWRETIVKTVSSFYAQRCGMAVPGIHGVCHRDWLCVHGDRKILINGGWHDAGDLSQGLVNTAEAVYAMLALSEHLESGEPELSRLLFEEALWGLDWVLRTRFGDGMRCTWATMDFWTDGILGTVDDVVAEAHNGPFENLLAASTEALAARRLREVDPIRAAYCLQAAREDWEAARLGGGGGDLELVSAFLNAALELYETTAEDRYIEAAFDYAETIMACQQVEYTDWEIPVRGFFYTRPDHRRLVHYSHRSHEQAPIEGLVRLARVRPNAADRLRWDATIGLCAEYWRTVTRHTAPWWMLPASIYRVNEFDEVGLVDQVRRGVRLSEEYYLRRFPVWGDFRGNYGVMLSQAKGLAIAGAYLDDQELRDLVQRQLQWVVGLNPFCQSTMYGEGYNFAPQYSAMSGDLVGGLPVGIQTRFEGDAPYWPTENCYNWKEIWVHPSTRWLGVMRDLYAGAAVSR